MRVIGITICPNLWGESRLEEDYRLAGLEPGEKFFRVSIYTAVKRRKRPGYYWRYDHWHCSDVSRDSAIVRAVSLGKHFDLPIRFDAKHGREVKFFMVPLIQTEGEVTNGNGQN